MVDRVVRARLHRPAPAQQTSVGTTAGCPVAITFAIALGAARRATVVVLTGAIQRANAHQRGCRPSDEIRAIGVVETARAGPIIPDLWYGFAAPAGAYSA